LVLFDSLSLPRNEVIMKDLVIGVVGGGVVGRATARTYVEHVKEVRVYDHVSERRTHNIFETLESDIVFVCLPTPKKEVGLGLDLSAITNFFAARFRSQHVNFVLRSTVPIGTTRRLSREYDLPNLTHSPEFLTARCALTDAQIPSRNIVGYTPGDQNSMAARDRLMDLYMARFPSIPIYCMSSDESEAVKLFQNSFFATKVAFWNECRSLADKLGLDWERVMGGVLSDGRISPSHTQVPGPDSRRGFGGSCLPKDLNCLVNQLLENDLPALVTSAVGLRNTTVDRRES